MANFRKNPSPIVVFLLSAFACASGFAVDPDAAQSPEKGENTAKSGAKPPELTRDYLLAHGFKQSKRGPDWLGADNVRLADVASVLGFKISAIRHSIGNPPGKDAGHVVVQEKLVVLRSEVHNTPKGPQETLHQRAVHGTGKGPLGRLRNPDTICTVEISLKKYVPPPPPLKTDSNPRVTVKSVVVPKDHTKPLRVTFEIAAEGKLPLGLLFNQIYVRLTLGDSVLCETDGPFSDGFEEFIYLIKPGSPRTFKVTVPDDSALEDGDWDGLHPGKDKYAVQVGIDGRSVLKSEAFDYSWVNGRPRRNCKVESKKFEFTVK